MTLLWRSCVLITVYVVLGFLALKLATPGGYATAMFPPAGLAMVAALMTGKRYLPAIWLGAFLLNSWLGMQARLDVTPSIFFIAIGIACASMAQAWLGAFLLRRYLPVYWHPFQGADMLRFMVLGGPVACLVAASGGTTSLYLGGP